MKVDRTTDINAAAPPPEQQAREVLCCDAAESVVRVSWTRVGEQGSAAAYAFAAYEFSRARRSSERFAPAVEYVRDAAGGRYDALSCICCTIGPGSFTGLRNCLAFVKGLLAAHDSAPYAAGVRAHDIIAHAHALREARMQELRVSQATAHRAAPLLVCADARSGRYYAALYLYSGGAQAPHQNQTYLPEYLPEYFTTPIDDLTAEEIAKKLAAPAGTKAADHAGERVIRLAGSAAEAIAPQLERLTHGGYDIRVLPALSSEEMLRALQDIGLYYCEQTMCPITELSEPLYVRGAV